MHKNGEMWKSGNTKCEVCAAMGCELIVGVSGDRTISAK